MQLLWSFDSGRSVPFLCWMVMENFQKAVNVGKRRNSLVDSNAMGIWTTYLFTSHSWLVLFNHPKTQIDTTSSRCDGKGIGMLDLALNALNKSPNSSLFHLPDLVHASRSTRNLVSHSDFLWHRRVERFWKGWERYSAQPINGINVIGVVFQKALSHSWESSKQNTTPHSFQFT